MTAAGEGENAFKCPRRCLLQPHAEDTSAAVLKYFTTKELEQEYFSKTWIWGNLRSPLQSADFAKKVSETNGQTKRSFPKSLFDRNNHHRKNPLVFSLVHIFASLPSMVRWHGPHTNHVSKAHILWPCVATPSHDWGHFFKKGQIESFHCHKDEDVNVKLWGLLGHSPKSLEKKPPVTQKLNLSNHSHYFSSMPKTLLSFAGMHPDLVLSFPVH